jgi:hypothetical protein
MLKKLLSLLGLGGGRKRATLMVTVMAGRRACGALRALDADGRDLLGAAVPIAARADDALASRHGNPGHDALRPYGDPACGTYQLIAIDRLAGAPEVLRDELGDCQLLFEPSEGDAARAEAGGRLLLGLHGGRLGADSELRATAGGLRLRNDDLEKLLRAMAGITEWGLEVREEAPRMLASPLSSEPAGAGVDPPIPFSEEARRAIERRGSPTSGSEDDSWRSRDDDWRTSRDRDTYSSSGPAIAAAAGAAAGLAAAQQAESKSDIAVEAEEHDVRVMDSAGAAERESGSASADSSSGTTY